MWWKEMIRQQWVCVILVSMYAVDLIACLYQWEWYSVWLSNLPYVGAWAVWIRFAIVLVILTVLVLLIVGRRKVAWQLHLWIQVGFVGYLCTALLTTDAFFLPFHPWWDGMRWWDRMLIALATAWLGWVAFRREAPKEKEWSR